MNPPLITEACVRDGLDATHYHHPRITPEPALTAGFGWRLQSKCAALAWHGSGLNPEYEAPRKTAFDIGSAAHLLFLEPQHFDARVVVIAADDYRTKEPRDQRDRARLVGKIPLLSHQAEQVAGMRRALRNEVEGLPFSTAPSFADEGFRGGRAEVSYFWQARLDTGGLLWMKARPDFVKPGHVIDYKTSASADPRELPRIAFGMGWHLRSAHYLEGHKALTGESADYWYIVQEKEPPYLTTVAKLDRDSIEWGRIQLDAAKAQFATCLRYGRWPAYSDRAIVIGLPSWAQHQLQDRHDAGDFDPKQYFEFAAAMQAPLDHGSKP